MKLARIVIAVVLGIIMLASVITGAINTTKYYLKAWTEAWECWMLAFISGLIMIMVIPRDS